LILQSARWIAWNIFLALVPVALAYGIAAFSHQARRYKIAWLALAPLVTLWFIFLPNSCYLFTEPVHLLEAVEQSSLWPRARHDSEAALQLGLWTGVSLCYVAVGALSFALAIRLVRATCEQADMAVSRWAALFFFLQAIGVYLGRIVRYNSWDLLTRPTTVLETAVSLVNRPILLSGLALFGLFLWLAYVVADVWIDGALLRWRQWARPTEAAREAGAREYCGQRG
jgi:uncharacterized membrane protein